MPIKDSAKKYMKVTEKKTSLNKKEVGSQNAVKEVVTLTKEGKKEDAKKALVKAQKALDKAVKAGVIKENTASRKKSRLSKAIKAIA